ncbi:DNA-binding response OmpR family regulator [Paenibacillus cellulosilyticus]|uniref:Heme response regulator HssR n=1 Tax=Paenibacillus cellulosilyticus TaxID=375489 RepID=A0A2V2Z9G6_9BACL|nr:response regulator transcription factor [Paenibacillus cellulosilyticus]PWW08761.1 DNA-binding response OmpR family regulator [Paenibacillus cellulosilyticus]QKS48317.1 response regulator transcription factor [Paenibacillus cellulosilyticus]
MANLLVVDDDPNIRELIEVCLKDEGFQVVGASNGRMAMHLLRKQRIDLAVIDIMMPVVDGWELCTLIKESYPDLPVMMVSAKNETMHKIKGLQLGADDYVVKPFDPLEIVARVRTLLRRYKIQASMIIEAGELQLDKNRYEIVWKDRRDSLPLKEFDLLFKLVSNPGKIFTRYQLIEQIWGIDFDGDERTVDVHVMRIRERLAALDNCKVTIVTKRGLGYKMEVAE